MAHHALVCVGVGVGRRAAHGGEILQDMAGVGRGRECESVLARAGLALVVDSHSVWGGRHVEAVAQRSSALRAFLEPGTALCTTRAGAVSLATENRIVVAHIPDGISSYAVLIASSAAPNSSYAPWALVVLAAASYGLSLTSPTRAALEDRRNDALSTVGELLKILDATRRRGITERDIRSLRAKEDVFRRLARIRMKRYGKIREVRALAEAITELEKLPAPPTDGDDRGRYQQQLGEAVGRLRAAAEAAHEALTRL